MLFMNECEIQDAVIKYRHHPILSQATQELERFMDLVNNNSDGWPYWAAAPRAAKRLMELIQKPADATDVALKKALTPIKSFCTKHRLF